MNISEILNSINAGQLLKNAGIILVVLMTVIQIAPIKINPWGWLARCIGRAINGEVIHKVSKLEDELAALRKDTAEQAIVNCRVRILQFGDELLQDIHHSKDRFDQTLRDIDAYESYCKAHPDFQNSVTVMTVQRIKKVYNDLLASGDFL